MHIRVAAYYGFSLAYHQVMPMYTTVHADHTVLVLTTVSDYTESLRKLKSSYSCTYMRFKIHRGKPLILLKGCSLYRAATLRKKFQRPISSMKPNTTRLRIQGVPVKAWVGAESILNP
jgi:hypothetical protein